MSLQSGTRIGGYEIIALVGAGGMGEVYRARDTRLGRDVAIKILSPRIAADRDSVLRFEREARALATLNHPNIAAIYDVIESGGQPALVLELVDGLTLADRIATGPLSIGEAIGYAKQIADALDVAHEAGIVHRDLKPGNIKVTEDGRIKVLDFGLAKAIAAAAGELSEAEPANSPTITVHGTRQGVILGTAAYMSPEQARGKRIDKRTDIWAFGCVLYEMLTRRPAFAGETTSDVIAAIIERAPDLSLLPPPTPANVRRVIARCLEKDPKRRIRDIADVRADLDGGVAAVIAAPGRSPMRLATVAAAAVGAMVIAGIAGSRWLSAPPLPSPVIEFAFSPPPGNTLIGQSPAVSPDGRKVAFLATDDKQVPGLWVRSLDSASVRRLEGTDGMMGSPIWSPDSQSLAFFANRSWKRISADGGAAVTIVSNLVSNTGASWGRDDMLLLSPANRTSLSRVPVSGGALQPVTTLDTEQENSHRWPQILPGGRHFLFTARSDRPENLGIKVGSFDTKDVRTLLNVASSGVYVEPGWLLFMTPDEAVMAQPFDASTQRLSGTAQPVAARVRYNGPSFEGSFDGSRDGRVLVFIPGARTGSTLMWFDRKGQLLGRVGPDQDYRNLAVSPDGRTAVVELADPQYGTRDLWLMDLKTNALTRLTTNPATDWQPVFSADGRTIAFASDRSGASTVFRVAADGTGGESVVYRDPDGGGAFVAGWSRNGDLLVTRGSSGKLLLVPAGGGAVTTIVDNPALPLITPRLSPDGDRLAFVDSASGSREVYVISLADRRRVRVSTEGGFHPTWGYDGRELFFQNPSGDIMRAELGSGTDIVAAVPATLFRPCALEGLQFGNGRLESVWDVSADGSRFLVNCSPLDSTPSSINVVVNWQSRLK